jgi:hypothetical protein
MSNLFSPHKYNSSFIEGTVLEVDPIRFCCSVRTINNKIFQDVRWLLPSGGFTEAGVHVTPNIQDRVLISTALGYPLILGCIPRIGIYAGETSSMTGDNPTIDLGSDSNISGGATANPSKPKDFLPGDLVYTARGGAMLAILSSGLSILKASSLSQIILSKFEGLVRIVTRNYQRFSDASSSVSTNMKGRLYEFFGADWDITKNQTGQERYQEVYGDVAAGEVLRGFPSPSITIPAQDTRVRKQWLKDAAGNSVMVETLYQDGTLSFIVESWNTNSTPGVINSNTTTSINNSHNTTVTDQTNTSYITITPTSTVVNSTDGTNTSSITISPTSICVDNNGKAKGTFEANDVTLTYNNKGTIILSNTSTIIEFQGGGIGTFDAAQASLSMGGHFCAITSGGVSLG